jgi:hypothetical protein
MNKLEIQVALGSIAMILACCAAPSQSNENAPSLCRYQGSAGGEPASNDPSDQRSQAIIILGHIPVVLTQTTVPAPVLFGELALRDHC